MALLIPPTQTTTMIVTKVMEVRVEVPAHYSNAMKADEALRLVGRGQGFKHQVSEKTKQLIYHEDYVKEYD